LRGAGRSGAILFGRVTRPGGETLCLTGAGRHGHIHQRAQFIIMIVVIIIVVITINVATNAMMLVSAQQVLAPHPLGPFALSWDELLDDVHDARCVPVREGP